MIPCSRRERGEKRERGIAGRIVCIVRESGVAKSARPVRRRHAVKRGPHATKGRAVAQPFVRAQESPVVAGRA